MQPLRILCSCAALGVLGLPAYAAPDEELLARVAAMQAAGAALAKARSSSNRVSA